MKRATRSAYRSFAIGLTLAALVWCGSAHAQGYFWTNTVGGAWSTANNWTNGAPSPGGSIDDVINFYQTGGISSTNNLGNPSFLLNELNFGGTEWVSLYGSNLTFTANSVNALPSITQNGSGGGTYIYNSVTLSNDLLIGGAGHAATYFQADVSGLGGIIVTGPLSLVYLNGANTYSGPTIISNGVLAVGTGSGTGTLGTGNVTNNSSLMFLRGDTYTVGNLITGSGSLSVFNGTLILTNDNNYTGGTVISFPAGSGTLQVGDGGNTGSLGSGDVNNNSSLIFNRNDTFTVGNQITGSGSLTMTGGGVLTLNGANTFSGGTTIGGSVGFSAILAGNNAAFGTGSITVGEQTYLGSSGGARSLNNDILLNGTGGLDNSGGTLTLSGVISGGGSDFDGVYLWGGNKTIFTGNNTYTNTFIGVDGPPGVTLPNTVLQIGNGGTDGTLGFGIVEIGDSCTLIFNRSDNITVSNNISGTGSLTQMGAALTLAGANTYSGGTIITNGATLYITNGSGLGTGDVHMYNGTTLGFLANMTFANNVILYEDPTFYVTTGVTVVETGVISGAGDLVKTGGGTLTLAGDNIYTGPTTINEGVLKVGDGFGGGLSGSLGTGAVTNYSSLIFNRADEITVANTISGTGSLTQLGSGTTILTADNDYSGVTRINSGTLQVGAGGTTGSLGTGIVTNNSVLAFDRSNTYTVNNVINGSGALVQNGSGTLILNASNNYSGGTWINDGTLVVASGRALGNSVGDVNMNGGALGVQGDQTINNQFHLLENGTFNTSGGRINLHGMIDGDGALIATGGGTLTLRGTGNSYGGGTIITNGTTVLVGRNYALGLGQVTMSGGTTLGFIGNYSIDNAIQLNGNSLLFVTNGATGTAEGDISGTGNLVKIGAGTLALAGNNTYSGVTIISNGVLRLDGGGTLGTGNVTNWSSLVFNRPDDFTVANHITGTGSLTQNGDGTVTLTANNNYGGITYILNGALQIGNGGVTGTLGTGNVIDNSLLIFNRSNTMVVSNNISGTGIVRQQGTGLTVMNGNNSYIGGTWIDSGTLAAGSGTAFGSAAVTMNGGTLGAQGNQTLGNAFLMPVNGYFNTAGGNLTLNGQIAGTGWLINTGGGSLTLNGANSYSGGTSNQMGWLVVGNNSALGSGWLIMNGGTLSSGGGSLSITLGNQIYLANHGTVDTGGGNLVLTGPITGTNDLWKLGANRLTFNGNTNVYRDTYVQAGTLEIMNASITSNRNAFVGHFTNGAAAIVKDDGTAWIMSNTTYVGLFGNSNSLTITNAGLVSDRIGWIGYGGDNNSALVTGSNTVWNNTYFLTVGAYGGSNNTLTIRDQGLVASSNSYVGLAANYNSALVTGTNSLWNNSANLFVGYGGGSYNKLTIRNGGVVNNVNGFVGVNGDGNSALVTGPGSLWNNTGNLIIGSNSSYNILTINNGGLVSNVNAAIGYSDIPVSYNTGIVDNATWVNMGYLAVGVGDDNNILVVTNGGKVYSYEGAVGVADDLNHAIVTGTGSLWENIADLYVGMIGGSYNRLSVLAGALVTNVNGYVGYYASMNTGLVDNATWANTGDLVIGLSGDANALTVQNTGKVYSVNGYVGAENGNWADANTATVTGPGSSWINSSNLFVGMGNAYNNGLIVTNGGFVSNVDGYVGASSDAWFNSALVTGTGSRWINAGNLTVGLGGQYNNLLISAGGLVSNVYGHVGNGGHLNTATVTGPNSTWINAADLFIGLNTGSYNILTVSDGGYVENRNGYIGRMGSDFNVALVTDAGSRWVNHGDLFLGYNPSSNNSLVISNGGVVIATNTWLGYDAGSTNNSITVTDANSLLLNYGNLTVGVTGSYNWVSIQNQGVASNANGVIGAEAAAHDNWVTVNNGSWINSADVYVGANGYANRLTITNGGHVQDVNAWVGGSASASNNSALVSGPGSLWDNSGSLTIGSAGAYNLLTINNGGLVSNVNGFVGFSGGTLNTAIVNNATWINTFRLYVGYLGNNNALIVTNAGVVKSQDGYVGLSGNNNSALVSGPGSLWANSGMLYVGDHGLYNTLTINNGGLVSNTYGWVGLFGNANTAIVNNATWVNIANLAIGDNANQNALIVTNAGVVKSAEGYVGYYGNNNSALVSGPASLWANSSDLWVGDHGLYNTLTINNGGLVSNRHGYVGSFGTANTAIVNNATWINTGNLFIGDDGNQNVLIVTNAGIVRSVNGYVGNNGSYNTALVSGTGSLWANSADLRIGNNGFYNRLTINNGGLVSNVNGAVGFFGNLNTAVVDNATWINTGFYLIVGLEGDQNALIVTNAGVVRSGNGYVGSDGDANSALVSGPGSLWNNTGMLLVGQRGSHNRLTITNGGIVNNTHGVVGTEWGSSNNSALVSGGGSMWIITGDLAVGDEGNYNLLTINNGGLVSNLNGFVGSSGNANTAIVNNATWINTGDLYVGNWGNQNALIVTNAGYVQSVTGYVGDNGDNNSALVTGTGSLWNNSANLFIGLNGGSYNSLTISAGGQVNNVGGVVGANADNNSVLVTGAGSLWNNSLDLFVGSNSSYNILTVLDGGLVSNRHGYIGYNSGVPVSYNTGIVDNATWVNAGSLTVGYNDDNNVLRVQNAGKVYSANGYIGVNSGGWWNQATVTGTGSLWSNTANLFVGLNGGSYNSLTISAGGRVHNVNGYVGNNSSHNHANVYGSGSLWTNTADLFIGVNGGSYNYLYVHDGARVHDVNGYVGNSANQNWAYVYDVGVWNNTGNLIVGFNGGSGNGLDIYGAGQVNSVNGYIGTNANNNLVNVYHDGSLWNMTGDLFVGLNGGSYNSLYIWDNGTVLASNLFIGDATSYDNYVRVDDGGNLVVTNTGGGLVDIRNGFLHFDEGNIILNHLFIQSNGDYWDSGDGRLTLVNPNPIIEIAGGKIITINSTIAGIEGMSKEGAGELILTAANIYTGPTFVNNGTLTVMNSDGVGSGNMNVMNGTLRTGSEETGNPLMINITGSYTQAVPGQLELGIGGTTFPENDWLNIGGDASLNGTLRVFKLDDFVPCPFDEAVLLVAAGGVTGTFSNFVYDIPTSPMLLTNLVYNPNDVTLMWSQLPFTPWAITPNQLAVAGALDSAITNPIMKQLFCRLDYPDFPAIPTEAVLSNTLPRDFDLIAPDELSAMFSIPFAAMDMRGYSFLARVQELRAGSHGFNANRLALYDTSGPGNTPEAVNRTQSGVTTPCNDICAPAKDNPWGLYLEGNGEYIDVDSDYNAAGYHLRSGGFTLGLDRRVGKEFAVGLTLGYGYDDAGLVNDGSVNVDGARGSLYATWFKQGFHLEAMAIGGLNWYETKRYAIDGMARGKTDGYEYGGLIGGGYDWQKGIWFFGPQVTLQYKRVEIDGFKEEGSLSPLDILSQGRESFYTRVGAHLGCRKKVGKEGKIIVAPSLSLAWQHEYLDKAIAVDSRFANGAGDIFTVHGPDIGRDSLVIGAGIWVHWSPLVGTYLNYTTQLMRNGYEPHNLNVGVCFKF